MPICRRVRLRCTFSGVLPGLRLTGAPLPLQSECRVLRGLQSAAQRYMLLRICGSVYHALAKQSDYVQRVVSVLETEPEDMTMSIAL